MTELIVLLPLFRIVQDIVGVLNLFKSFSGFGVVRLRVGMVDASEFAIRLANFIRSRRFRNTERFVVVFCHV